MRQRHGDLEIRSVYESEGRIPMQLALPGITARDLAQLKRWHWSDELSLDPEAAIFRIDVRSYLLRVDGLNVLIDACCGNDKQRSVPWAHQLQTAWLQNLAREGCAPEDIHLVLCTHLHADHVGWNTRLKGDRWVPTFPNARYVISRKEVEGAGLNAHELHTREAYLDSVLPVIEAGQADLVDSDHCVHREIEDGIWLQDAAGHSPGSVVVNARRRGPRVVFAGDILHHPVQVIRPDVPFFVDEDPAAACATRQELLAQCADSDAVMYPAHFPDPAGGRVRRAGEGFSFEFV